MTRYSGAGIGGGLIADYQHNGRGERVSKEIAGDMILYLCDESGRLLGEYEPPKTGSNAQVIREYVYTDELPLAILDPVPIGGSVYYIHAGHLGTLRAVTSDNDAKRWEWQFQGNPFGVQPPDEDPESTGTAFTLNLRFPGQYYDAESGLYYNYFRDYEPSTGRYVQSDPIGLRGGMTTFVYADNDPLMHIDPFGLQAAPLPLPIPLPRPIPMPVPRPVPGPRDISPPLPFPYDQVPEICRLRQAFTDICEYRCASDGFVFSIPRLRDECWKLKPCPGAMIRPFSA